MAEVTEVWTYIGRRLGKSDRVIYCWQDPSTTIRSFRKNLVRYAGIGARYEVTLEREGESVNVFTGGEKSPRFLDSDSPKDDVLAWSVDERTDVQTNENHKEQKKVKDRDVIREALLPIRQIVYSRKTRAAQSAVVQLVITELWRPLDKSEWPC